MGHEQLLEGPHRSYQLPMWVIETRYLRCQIKGSMIRNAPCLQCHLKSIVEDRIHQQRAKVSFDQRLDSRHK